MIYNIYDQQYDILFMAIHPIGIVKKHGNSWPSPSWIDASTKDPTIIGLWYCGILCGMKKSYNYQRDTKKMCFCWFRGGILPRKWRYESYETNQNRDIWWDVNGYEWILVDISSASAMGSNQ